MTRNIIDFSTIQVMGIININPDSFFKTSRAQTSVMVLKQAEKMLEEGANILDLGAFSSRPGAELISLEEELKRLKGPLVDLIKRFPEAKTSIDTYRSEIAEMALNEGAAMINDISGGNFDPRLPKVIQKWDVPYVIMHMRGEPKTMQSNCQYNDVVQTVYSFFEEKIAEFQELGIRQLILDPGFGFAKTRADNFLLLKELNQFKNLGQPLLVGISRKKMVQETIDAEVENALNGSTALHAIALQNGAKIVRVHDVKEAVEVKKLVDYLQKQ